MLGAAAASACFALVAGVSTAAAESPRIGQAEGVFAIGIPQAAGPAEPAPGMDTIREPAPALVQAIWDLGAAEDWDAAQKVLRALQSSNPDWQPPARLASYLAAGRRDQVIRDALAAGDWTGALSGLPAPPAAACEAPFHLWARAEALEGIGAQPDINAFYIRSLTACTQPGLVASLAGRGLTVLDAGGLAAVSTLETLAHSGDTGVRLAHTRLVRAVDLQRFDAALAAGDLAAARALAAASDDPGLLTRAGWTFLERDPSRASGYFEKALALGGDSDALRGLVMATPAAGRIPAARKALAQANGPPLVTELGARLDLGEAGLRRDSGDWTGAVELASSAAQANADLAGPASALIASARFDASTAAYEKGEFAEAKRLALEAAEHTSLRRAGLLRAAWSDLQTGRGPEAADAFSRLYLELPDAESAEGFALAAERTGGLDAAAAVARTVGGPLGARIEARFASAAFGRGDFLAARARNPGRDEALRGIDGAWFRQAVSVRRQGGTQGENRFGGTVSTTSAGTTRGPNRFEAGVSVYTLDAGRAATRETFAAPFAAWSREGQTSLAARIGLLPAGAEADPALNLDIAAARETGGGVIEGGIFIRPRTDSVFAMAGQSGGAGNAAGRVTETGAHLSARLQAGKRLSVQAGMSGASLEGRNTADNTMAAAGVSVSRAFERSGFAYLVTGPFYQYQSYDQNTNFFTAGHGGYFSPQAFHRAGWSMNAQTDPLKRWITRANLAVAHETVEEAPALVNPLLSGPQRRFGGARNSGIAGALDLAVARRLSANILVAANTSATVSQAFEDIRFGLALTWVPGGRGGLARTDLPSDPFNPGTWIQP